MNDKERRYYKKEVGRIMLNDEDKEAGFWDKHGVLDFVSEMDESISLDSKLKEDILSGKRRMWLAENIKNHILHKKDNKT